MPPSPRLLTLAFTAVLAGVLGCGPVEPASSPEEGDEPPVGPPPPSASASASAAPPVASAEPAAADPAASARAEAEARVVSRLLSGWVVALPAKADAPRAFALVTSFAEEGSGMGTVGSVVSVGREDDEVTLCEPAGDCDGDEEAVRAAVASWVHDLDLSRGLALEPVEFASAGGVIGATVGALGGKLVWRRDHLDLVRGPKTASLPKLAVDKEFTARPYRVVATPDGADLVVLYELDPGAHYAEGFNLYVDAKAYKTP